MLENTKRKIYLRSVLKGNKSISINIPSKLARKLDINEKDFVRIEMDENEEYLLVRKIELENL